jgi:hypothetical protein
VNLYHFPYRDYSPGMSRWLWRDPLGMVDGANSHIYGHARPGAFTDLLGLWVTKYPWRGPVYYYKWTESILSEERQDLGWEETTMVGCPCPAKRYSWQIIKIVKIKATLYKCRRGRTIERGGEDSATGEVETSLEVEGCKKIGSQAFMYTIERTKSVVEPDLEGCPAQDGHSNCVCKNPNLGRHGIGGGGSSFWVQGLNQVKMWGR